MGDKIIIAGGTGFLGQSLQEKFQHGRLPVVILTRKPVLAGAGISYVKWDGKSSGDWVKELTGSKAVINLTGKSVNCRYTEANKKEIIESRVNATLAIAKAINEMADPPKVWINAGSTAIFGNGGNTIKDEDSPLGEGFSAEVCKQWEESFYSIETPLTRKVLLRMGLVFQKNRGLLKPFVRLVKFGLGGKIGSGKQYISWIHEDDFTEVVQLAIDSEDWEGTIHCSSPLPIKNRRFLKALHQACKVRIGIPSPSPLIKIGARIIGTEPELLLAGRRVISKILKEKGYQFKYPKIEEALDHLVSRGDRSGATGN